MTITESLQYLQYCTVSQRRNADTCTDCELRSVPIFHIVYDLIINFSLGKKKNKTKYLIEISIARSLDQLSITVAVSPLCHVILALIRRCKKKRVFTAIASQNTLLRLTTTQCPEASQTLYTVTWWPEFIFGSVLYFFLEATIARIAWQSFKMVFVHQSSSVSYRAYTCSEPVAKKTWNSVYCMILQLPSCLEHQLVQIWGHLDQSIRKNSYCCSTVCCCFLSLGRRASSSSSSSSSCMHAACSGGGTEGIDLQY